MRNDLRDKGKVPVRRKLRDEGKVPVRRERLTFGRLVGDISLPTFLRTVVRIRLTTQHQKKYGSLYFMSLVTCTLNVIISEIFAVEMYVKLTLTFRMSQC